jgi:hypothetical protein
MSLNLPRWLRGYVKHVEYAFDRKDDVYELHTGERGAALWDSPDYAMQWLASKGTHLVTIGIKLKNGTTVTLLSKVEADFMDQLPKSDKKSQQGGGESEESGQE